MLDNLLKIAATGLATTLALPAPAASQAELEVDYQRSSIVAKLNKGGLLRFLGHEHGIVPGAWSATVVFDENDLESSSIVVEIPVVELIIDSAEARAAAGVDPDGPNEEEVAEIRVKMLSDEQLDAETYPTIRFESTRIGGNGDELRIDGRMRVRGVSRDIDIEADLERDGDGYVVRGAFELKHKDFGIDPVSIGGVVKVGNDIDVSFEIFATEPRPGRADERQRAPNTRSR